MEKRTPQLVLLGQKMRQARRFWAERLARERSPSGLPLDKPRPTSYRCETSAVTFAVSAPLREAIRRLTGDRPLLVCALVMAAAGVVLQKVTGAQVIAIGTPGRREHEQATALPIVIDLDPARSMRMLLMDIKQSLGEAYAHEEYPYDAIVRDVGVEQPGAKCPLFDVSVSFDGFHGALPETRHDAAIHLTCDDTSITGRVEYNALLFERATMSQFSDRVVRVLGATLADPNALVGKHGRAHAGGAGTAGPMGARRGAAGPGRVLVRAGRGAGRSRAECDRLFRSRADR